MIQPSPQQPTLTRARNPLAFTLGLQRTLLTAGRGGSLALLVIGSLSLLLIGSAAYADSAPVQVANMNAEIFRWRRYEWDVAMKPVNSHICFLTRVSGAFGGTHGDYNHNSAVVLHRSTTDIANQAGLLAPTHINDTGPTWKLGGFQNASNNSLTADATCVPISNFFLDPGMVVWVSGLTSPELYGEGTETRLLWWGNAISYIAGLQGQFNGGGEVAEIIPGEWNAPSTLRLRSQVRSATYAWTGAYSVFIGYPDQPGTKRLARVSQGGNKKTKLALTSEAICYLVKISGDFNGSEERVRISPVLENGIEYWYLETHEGRRSSANATAECIPYNQSDL